MWPLTNFLWPLTVAVLCMILCTWATSNLKWMWGLIYYIHGHTTVYEMEFQFLIVESDAKQLALRFDLSLKLEIQFSSVHFL